jgi:hypothetical protein
MMVVIFVPRLSLRRHSVVAMRCIILAMQNSSSASHVVIGTRISRDPRDEKSDRGASIQRTDSTQRT